MSTITFDALSAGQKRPDVLVERDLTGGRQSLPSTAKRCLLVGYGLAAGSAVAQELLQVYSEQDAAEKWGTGSHLHLMARAFLKVSPNAELWAIAYAEGAMAVAASGTVTLATAASSGGTLRVYLQGRLIQVGVAKDETPTTVGDRLVAAINARTDLAVTAANAVGVVTFTARNKGPVGNSIRLRCEITASGMTATASGAVLASGATEGDPTTALTKALAMRWHIACLNTDDSTVLAALESHQEAASEPAAKRYGMTVAGSGGALSAATTLAGGSDSYRAQIVWQKNAEMPTFEIAAAFAGRRCTVADPAIALDDDVLSPLAVTAARADWPTDAELESALTNGVTPLVCLPNGDVAIVRSVTTRVTAPAYIDHNPTEIMDYHAVAMLEALAVFKGKVLKTQSPVGTSKAVSLRTVLQAMYEVNRKLDSEDLIEGTEDHIKEGTRFKAETDKQDTSRLNLAFPSMPVNRAHLITALQVYVQV